MANFRPTIATLTLILLQTCGCGMNREVVNDEDPRPFWEPKIRQTTQTEIRDEVFAKEELEAEQARRRVDWN